MALEKPPKMAKLDPEGVKTYLPPRNQIYEWHTVRDGRKETWTTIAANGKVPVDALIEFNFPGSIEKGKLVPEIVNWYLGNHNAYKCPQTNDRKNRRFRGGERVAIPIQGYEIGDIIYSPHPRAPESLEEEAGHLPDIIPGQKFAGEGRFPPKGEITAGYFIFVIKYSYEGEIVSASSAKLQYKKGKVKAAVEKKLEDGFKAGAAANLEKIDGKYLEGIINAAKSGKPTAFVTAIMAPFEFSLKKSFESESKTFSLTPEAALEFSNTPIGAKVSFNILTQLPIMSAPTPVKLGVKLGVNIGLSQAGWRYIISKIGPEALKRLLARLGGQFAAMWEVLVAEGIVLGAGIGFAAIVAGITCTALMAWTLDGANQRGDKRGYATWYSAGYVARLFNHPLPAKPPVGDMAVIDEMIALGAKDAVTDGRRILRDNNREEANGSDDAVLRAYRQAVIDSQSGDENAAKVKLRDSLTQKSKQAAGL